MASEVTSRSGLNVSMRGMAWTLRHWDTTTVEYLVSDPWQLWFALSPLAVGGWEAVKLKVMHW